jgi:hypothetical protein
VDAARIKQALVEVFDQAVVFHGFTAYMRDYEVVMWATADPRTGIAPEHLRLLFRHCLHTNGVLGAPGRLATVAR